jgi:hypothetical protein
MTRREPTPTQTAARRQIAVGTPIEVTDLREGWVGQSCGERDLGAEEAVLTRNAVKGALRAV